MSEGNLKASDGCVYMCGACGKTSRWRYGFDEKEKNDASPGWDESCSMWATLVDIATITDPVGWVYPMRACKAVAVAT